MSMRVTHEVQVLCLPTEADVLWISVTCGIRRVGGVFTRGGVEGEEAEWIQGLGL